MDPPNRRRYGVIEPELAERFGYHLPPDTARAARRAAEKEDRSRELSRPEQIAAYGKTGVGGCWNQAHEEILKAAPESDYNRLQHLSMQNFRKSEKDSEVQKSFRGWSACMQQAGFDYSTPLEAAGDKGWHKSETVSARERDAATADVRCKRETGMVADWAAAEAKVQQAVIRANPAEFRAFKATKERRLAAARRVLDADS